MGKTLANCSGFAKFVKVFPHDRFALYSITADHSKPTIFKSINEFGMYSLRLYLVFLVTSSYLHNIAKYYTCAHAGNTTKDQYIVKRCI